MEHFIESIRKYPCLWAINSPDYKINEFKDAAWRRVIKECDLPDIKEAKNLWKKLRDGHRQSLSRKKTTTGQAADNDKSWKYDKFMEFLLPYMGNRQRTTNAEPIPEQADSQQSQNTTNNETNIDVENNLNRIETITRKRKHNDSLVKYLEEEKKTRDKRAAERDLLRKQLLTQTQQEQTDVMKSFFNTMYEMSKSLPEHVQIKIQREVFNIVIQSREANSIHNFTGGTPFRLPIPTSRLVSSYSIHIPHQSSHLIHSPQPPHSYRVTSPPPPTLSNTNVNTYSHQSSHSIHSPQPPHSYRVTSPPPPTLSNTNVNTYSHQSSHSIHSPQPPHSYRMTSPSPPTLSNININSSKSSSPRTSF